MEAEPKATEYYGLIGSLGRSWLKIPFTVMRDVGPAVQTLGGLLRITNTETFVAVETIAAHASQRVSSARKHLDKLAQHGWLQYKGRGRTPSGAPRRTVTWALTDKTRRAIEENGAAKEYGVLPRFACSFTQRRGGDRLHSFPWGARAILSVVMSRLMTLKAVAEREGYEVNDVGDLDYLGGYSRFRFKLDELQKITGLSRDAVVSAKAHLAERKIITLEKSVRENGGQDIDALMPNQDWYVELVDGGNGWTTHNYKLFSDG